MLVVNAPAPSANIQGIYPRTPACLIHGTRSGKIENTLDQEFQGTVNFLVGGAGGLAWTFTIGSDEYAVHLPVDAWGYHCRELSDEFIGFEFAQPLVTWSVTEGQVRAFGHAVRNHVLPVYPEFDVRRMLMHSQINPGIRDGKTDVYPKLDPRWPRLKEKLILAVNGDASDPANLAWDRYYIGLGARAQLEVGRLIYRGNYNAPAHWPGGAANRPIYRCERGLYIYLADLNEIVPVTGFPLDDWETAAGTDLIRL